MAQQQQITSFISTAYVGKLTDTQENDNSVFSDSTLAKQKSEKRVHTCLSSDCDCDCHWKRHNLTFINEKREGKKLKNNWWLKFKLIKTK